DGGGGGVIRGVNHLSVDGARARRPERQRHDRWDQPARHAYHGSFSCCKSSRRVICNYTQLDTTGVVLTIRSPGLLTPTPPPEAGQRGGEVHRASLSCRLQ